MRGCVIVLRNGKMHDEPGAEALNESDRPLNDSFSSDVLAAIFAV